MNPGLPLLVPDWPAPPNVHAVMSTRQGGVSTGPHASLNLGERVGDDPANVAENRRRLREALELRQEPVWLKQVHGTNVVRLAAEQSPTPPPPRGRGDLEADASFTTEPGLVCAVQAADCLPVLFCDQAGSVVAAAHAGWRGLAAGVLEATVHALPAAPGALMAWLGAAIGPQSFEVGAEVRDAFLAHNAQADACFTPLQDKSKYSADLYGLARRRLAATGVTRVFGGGLCTFREAQRFFSYRRDGQCGRMAALIWLG